MISLAKEMIKENGSDGAIAFAQRFSLLLFEEYYNLRKGTVSLDQEVWREINFNALNLGSFSMPDSSYKILLNPVDEGFSREFCMYGFREPLNTFAIFNTIKKKKPFVLDIGSNLGYFSLIELAASAKHVIAVEPVPLTFSFLTRTLKKYHNVTALNIAMSDKEEMLKLYVAKKFNVTSSQAGVLKDGGHEIFKEIFVQALPLSSICEKYPVEMIRLDLEGHEYRLLSGEIPQSVRTICMELHVIPPFGREDVKILCQNLQKNGFKISWVIDEMPRGFYPFINAFGLEATYKLINNIKKKNLSGISYEKDVDFDCFANTVNRGIIHLILEKNA